VEIKGKLDATDWFLLQNLSAASSWPFISTY